jgi:hypothetical protein
MTAIVRYQIYQALYSNLTSIRYKSHDGKQRIVCPQTHSHSQGAVLTWQVLVLLELLNNVSSSHQRVNIIVITQFSSNSNAPRPYSIVMKHWQPMVSTRGRGESICHSKQILSPIDRKLGNLVQNYCFAPYRSIYNWGSQRVLGCVE